MTNSEATAVPRDREICPRCGAAEPVQSLLTSMARYFVCGRCAKRWQVAIVPANTVHEILPRA